MNLRRVTSMIENEWSALGFQTQINGDRADMHASINHPIYGDLVLEVNIRMFDNAARHFTLTIGDIPRRYVDRAIISVNNFNLHHAWVKAFVIEEGGSSKLYLKVSEVGYGSLGDEEVVKHILVAGDLMFKKEVAEQMLGILDGIEI